MPGFSELLKTTLAKDPLEVEFHSVRGRAIGAYASLEQSMCALFAHLSGTPRDVAGVVFFNIHSADSGLKIIDKLLKKKAGDTYSVFWKSIRNYIAAATQRRNEIVHWHVVKEIGDHGVQYKLTPPNFWDMTSDTPFISVDDLWDFFDMCDVSTRSCNMFGVLFNDEMLRLIPPESIKLHRDMCLTEFVYPLPEGHPLAVTLPKPTSG